MLVELQATQAKYPQIGVLHKGSKRLEKTRDDGSTYWAVGKDLDHFRLDSEPEIVQAFTSLFGEKPNELPIYLNTEVALDSFEAWLETYDSKGITHRCDGEYLRGMRFQKDHRSKPKWFNYSRDFQRPCMVDCENEELRCDCKKVGRLRFIIPDLLTATGRVGEVLFAFTSSYDISEIYSNLSAFKGDATKGRFILRRVEREVTLTTEYQPAKGRRKEKEPKRMKGKKWLCQVIPEPEWVQAMFRMNRFDAIAAAPSENNLLLESPFDPEQGEESEMPVLPAEIVDEAPALPAETKTIDPLIAEAREATADIPDEDLLERLKLNMQRTGTRKSVTKQRCQELFGHDMPSQATDDQLRVLIHELQQKETAMEAAK